MILTFRLNEDRLAHLNIAAQIALKTLASGAIPELEDVRELMVWFIEDEGGDFMTDGVARRVIGRLSTDQFAQAIGAFNEAMLDWSVPKANGRPSEQEPTDGEPPHDG